jgi:hypothetical protein
MITRIFLDLDDVLNKFTMYALQYVGCPVSLDYANYDPEWGYDIVGAANALYPEQNFLPFTYKSFWNCFDEDAPASDEFSMLLDLSIRFVGSHNVCVLTRPVPFPGCLEGKRQWIRRHLPKTMEHNYLMGEPKYHCASSGALLIDDVQENVNKFRALGGRAILFPRPWNSLQAELPGDYVRGKFMQYIRTGRKAA